MVIFPSVRELFLEEIRGKIAKVIEETSGMEVFLVGSLNEEGIVEDVEVIARGNEWSAPALLEVPRPGEVIIHNHPSGNLTPSDEDVRVASIFGSVGVGFYIINNSVSQAYVVVEPIRSEEAKKLDIEELRKLLLPGGKVSKIMSNYELRPEQLDMLSQVSRAFNENLISLIEAGTGTGKTFAYLIPAVQWSLLNGERVVISTNTINLQEQLIGKDIPVIQSALGGGFKATLVKGMGNYLCLLRMENVQEGLSELVDTEEVDILKDIVEWSKVTKDGSLSDLNFTPPDDLWDKVAAESESCLRLQCPHYSECFFYKARRESASAQILVVNHHLLFSDLSLKGAAEISESGVLPSYKRVIFDEAHHLEEAATSHFGMKVTKFGIIRALKRLKRRGRDNYVRGLIPYVAAVVTKFGRLFRKSLVEGILRRVEETLFPEVDSLEEAVRDAFDEIYYFAKPFGEGRGEEGSELSVRITEDMRSLEEWKALQGRFSLLSIKLLEFVREIRDFTELLSDLDVGREIATTIIEFRGVASKLDFFAGTIEAVLSTEDDGYVRWIEGREGRGGNIVSGLGLSPIDVSLPLGEKLYSRCNTVVMTSATLSVGKSFEFIKSRLGLSESERVRVDEFILNSSFNYKEQAMLGVPTDLPDPNDREYAEGISPFILNALKTSGGRALVLFTSYILLERVFGEIAEALEEVGINPLKQGTQPRWKLLKEFRSVTSSVLFATDSFWEGVDVPGDALELVIITRLPFRVPTDPIIEARVEHMEKSGINPFLKYTIPIAVLKFKQGFGRLIRTKFDRGVVLVLDGRVIRRQYGRFFLNSLPPCKKVIAKSREVLKGLDSFFKSRQIKEAFWIKF